MYVYSAIGLIILPVFGCCDNSVRSKDWRCRKRGVQATCASQYDLAEERQCQSYECMFAHRFGNCWQNNHLHVVITVMLLHVGVVDVQGQDGASTVSIAAAGVLEVVS
jgi:hypothetical protein